MNMMCWDVSHDMTLLSLCLWWTWHVGVHFITCECNSVWPATWHCSHSVMGMMCQGVFHYLSATVCDPPHDTTFTLSVMDICVGVYFITCECNSVWPATWHCFHSVCNGHMCWGVFYYLWVQQCVTRHTTLLSLCDGHDMLGCISLPVSATVCDPPHDTAFTLSVMDICVRVYFITCECNSVWPATWHCFHFVCNGHDVLGYVWFIRVVP